MTSSASSTPGVRVAVTRRARLAAMAPARLDAWRALARATSTVDGRGVVVPVDVHARVTGTPRDDGGSDLAVELECELPAGTDSTIAEIVRQELDRALAAALERVVRVVGTDVVQEASEESFPASDAPAWTGR